VALFLKRVAGFPFSFTAHAQDFMVDLGSDELLRELCREAEFVVAVSNWSRDLLRRTCPDSAEKIVRVYNGIDPEEFPERAQFPERARPRIVDVARLIEFKGHHFLVDACAELRRRGVEFECTIVGEGPWRERLEARIREHGLGDRVELAGLRTQEEVKRLLIGSDVFVLPSVVDSKGACDVLPTVILEAMATALPVVSTTLAGVPELVEDGVTGLLAEPGDPAGLADALARTLASRELRRSLGEAGRKRLEERFASARSAPALHERFLASAARSPRRLRGALPSASFAWLLDRWPPPPGDGAEQELREVRARHPEAPILACALDERFEPTARGVDLAEATHVEFLPDGIVLEAAWLASPERRAAVDALREELPSFFSGEEYYREARRALWVADALRQRGIGHLHAARASSLLCAWLVKRLAGLRVSFALDRRGATSRRAYARLCRDLDFGAVSDDLLFETVRGECGEGLPLVTPLPRPRGMRPALPPLRPLRGWLRPAKGPNLERGVGFEAWLGRIAGTGRDAGS
jgi:Glycosyl transferases group 1